MINQAPMKMLLSRRGIGLPVESHISASHCFIQALSGKSPLSLIYPDSLPVLEIGCGTGTLAISCAEKSASVVGFDISSQMLAVARRKVQARNVVDKVQLREMGAIEMDKAFINETFDKIVSTLVFRLIHI